MFEAEADLLASRGHQVVRFERHNHELKQIGKLAAFKAAHWNEATVRDLTALIEAERPDVMHCTNTFPLISPSAYHAARRLGVGVVQTLHNYRLICPSAQLFRDGKVCRDCAGRTLAWPALVHGCYRGDRAATAAVVSMLAYHRAAGTWSSEVDRYIVLSAPAREEFVAAGLPADKITVKPNFLAADPGPGKGVGNYAVFVGRLAEEKGVRTLLDAWRRLPGDVNLKIAGQGPLEELVSDACREDRRISWLGHLSAPETYELIGQAQMLVVPSVWMEPFGLTVIEAFGKGTPVVASRAGALAELVVDGITGRLVRPGDPDDLAQAVQRMLVDPAALKRMRERARAEFEVRFTGETNYRQLLGIYRSVAVRKQERPTVGRTRRMVKSGAADPANGLPPAGLQCPYQPPRSHENAQDTGNP